MTDFPSGWDVSTINDLSARVTKGTTPKTYGFQYQTRGVLFVKAESLSQGRIQHELCAYIANDAHECFSRSQLQPKDVLFTIAGTLGRVATVEATDVPANTNQAVAIIRLRETALAPYVARYLTSEATKLAEEGGRGTGLQNLNLQQVQDFVVRLPPLPEQRRLVAKIDSLSGISKRARDHLDHGPRLVEKYKQAILAAAFRGELTRKWRETHREKSAWGSIEAGKIIQAIVSGKNMRCEERPPTDDERGVLKVSAVTWGTFDPQATKTLPKSFNPPDQTRVKSGDFLISRANTLELVGAVVIVQQTPENLFLSDKILRLEMAEENKPWLLWFLRSPEGRAAIESAATGNQLSMRNLSQAALREIGVPWPIAHERKAIVRCIETAFAWVDRIASETASARTLIDRLDQSVLAKAFRGELVPQDPNDEPASVLLERIRAERTLGNGPSRSRKRAS